MRDLLDIACESRLVAIDDSSFRENDKTVGG